MLNPVFHLRQIDRERVSVGKPQVGSSLPGSETNYVGAPAQAGPGGKRNGLG